MKTTNRSWPKQAIKFNWNIFCLKQYTQTTTNADRMSTTRLQHTATSTTGLLLGEHDLDSSAHQEVWHSTTPSEGGCDHCALYAFKKAFLSFLIILKEIILPQLSLTNFTSRCFKSRVSGWKNVCQSYSAFITERCQYTMYISNY